MKLERALVGALIAWAAVPAVLLFVDLPWAAAGSSGRGTFTGSAGLVIDDHAQYISWIRESGDHGLFSNRFDVIPDPHLFLHPMWLLSGLLWKAGVSLQLAFALWTPVGLAVLFAGFLLYVRRTVPDRPWLRATALVLALFFVTPAMWITGWTGVGSGDLEFGSLVMGLELFSAGYLWGLAPTAIAIGAVPLYLLAIERVLEPDRRSGDGSTARYAIAAAAAGATASWLHPWQGLIVLGISGGLVVWGGFGRHYLRLALPLAATLAPLVYYKLLTRTDSAWQTVSQPNGMPHVEPWLFLGLAPILLLALPGLLQRPGPDLQERALRLWPAIALAVYFGLDSSYFYHAFAGLTLPLGVLAVNGWRPLAPPRLVVVAVVAFVTLPGLAYLVDYMHREAPRHFLTRGESAAMAYLERTNRPGAVLASPELAVQVPPLSGRSTWYGHNTWTPDHQARQARAGALFAGALTPPEVMRLVTESRAAFVLQGCEGGRADLSASLGVLVRSKRRFGCARVYEISRPPPRAGS